MLQTIQKTTLLAAVLAAACFLVTPAVQAQHRHMSSSCGNNGCRTCGTACRDGGCRNGACLKGCRNCGLHHPQYNCRERQDGQPELFYNYYVPGTCGGAPAQLYIAPRPVPAYVGHTYYTYQPFMPHELLYQHHRTYYRYYDQGRGLTRTYISWYRPPVHDLLGGLANHFRPAR